MCEKCLELDEKILRHRKLAAGINDQPTVALLNDAIKKYEAEKFALHAGDEPDGSEELGY
jgi:hypothetical protein